MIAKVGSKGDDVTTLQSALRARGFYPAASVVDGLFGPQTEAAVKAFQRDAGLEVDGIVGPATWSQLLDPGQKIVSQSSFPPLVERWRAPYERADHAFQDQQAAHDPLWRSDPFPILRALRFTQLESGGNPCATGRIKGDHVMEAGLAQTYFETPTTRVHGITSAELRALCGCTGVSQHGGACTDHASQIHAEVAIADMHTHRARARVRLLNAGVVWDEGGLDFWRAVKLVHALPGMFSYVRAAREAAGGTLTWALYKGYVQTRTRDELAALDRGTAAYIAEFARVFTNCETFAAVGG